MVADKQPTTAFNIKFIHQTNPLYVHLQKVIQDKYQIVYNAMITPRPDLFIFLEDELSAHDICGACFGVTHASDTRLFSENYLDCSVEQVVYEKLGCHVSRHQIAEISSMIARKSMGSGARITELIPWLMTKLNVDFLLATMTTEMRQIMHQAKIVVHPITHAVSDRLPGGPEAAARWGAYYDTDPWTCIIDIKASLYQMMLPIFAEKHHLKSIDFNHPINPIVPYKGFSHAA